jgi:hypothetical protein
VPAQGGPSTPNRGSAAASRAQATAGPAYQRFTAGSTERQPRPDLMQVKRSGPRPGKKSIGGAMDKLSDMRTAGKTIKRILVLLTLATVGMAANVTAASAAATTNEQVSLRTSGFVPCANGGAGEIVSGTIEMHILITSTVNGNNASDQFQFQTQGSMVGAITGDTYRVTGVERGTSAVSLQNDHYVLTYVNTFQLIGPGPGNNLLVHEVAHMTIDDDVVVVDHDDWSIDCK